ncbi:MAG: PAS domain-containing protein [Cytophagales bacterium]|nr:MAG: PAS domain-containing protein [Cytophagales bacterium]
MTNVKTADLYLEQLPCGYILSDKEGKILQANTQFCQMIGYSAEQIIHQRYWQDFLAIGSKIYYETHYAPLLAMQGNVEEISFEFINKENIKIPTLVNAKKHTNECPNSYISIAIFEMKQRQIYEKELLVEKRKAEELANELKAINQDLEQFAHVISHDLKSPLGSIIQLTQLLKDNLGEIDEQSAFFLQSIENSSFALIDLISRVLKYYTQTEILNKDKEPIEIDTLINQIIILLDPKKEHQISFTNHANNIVYLSQAILQQLLINLLGNAIKYNDKPLIKIEITLTEDAEFYQLAIKDNGVGIEAKNQEKIFRLFNNLGKKDRFGNYGTGIGLPAIKRTLQSQGGSINVESTLGEGSCFTIKLKKQ